MLRNRIFASIFISAVLSFSAAAQQGKPAPPPATPQAPAPAPAVEDSNVVVARVSGEPITEKQVLDTIEALASQRIAMTPDQQKQRNTILFNGALEHLVTNAVLKNEARKQNLTVDSAKVDQEMKQLASRYPSQEEFQKAMSSQGITEAEVRKSVEERLLMQEVLNLAAKNVPQATDAEIQKFYDDNPDKFRTAEEAHIAQIFLKAEKGSTPEQRAALKSKLDSIRAEIEAKKITFADAAVKYSQHEATASKGGDLGFLSKTGTAKAVEDIVFGTAPGGMTPVIEDESGCRILQVIELKPAGTATLETAKPAIKKFLEQNARQKVLQKYVEDLRSKAAIQNFMTAEQFDKRHPVQ